jgi:crotonobetainyl-CoA:carnitine CoA-transferase CaiB-like acyl-CoA transferase
MRTIGTPSNFFWLTFAGASRRLAGRKPSAGVQPYDTFKCSDGWVYIGALGGPIYERVPSFLGLGCASIAPRTRRSRSKPS